MSSATDETDVHRRPVVLRTDAELQMGESLWHELSELAEIVTAADDRPATLEQSVPDADLIFTCYAPITAEVIAAGKKLRGIVKYGVGVDSIDLKAAARRGIPVVHCPDYGTNTVADQAFALLISLARQIPLLDREIRRQGWLWPEPKYLGMDLSGKTLGIVGFGRIGKAMARRGHGFGMKRLVCDPYVERPTSRWDDLEFAPFDRLLEEADFLSLHCVHTPETHGLIGAAELRRMKETALLINVSRGQLVDEQALAVALESGQIAGAGLDVFASEPLGADNPLLKLSNVICSPHFAFFTQEAHERLERECVDDIRQLLAGEIPRHVKNGDQLEAAGFEQYSTAGSELRVDAVIDRSEGDINATLQRTQWQQQHLADDTLRILDEDADAFLHQSLSTPCLNAVSASEGIYLIDVEGRRIMDFHGNSAHQVGYGHPRVIEAVKSELDRLPFCPRRYTNRPAIDLAQRLASLAPGQLNKVLFAPAGTAAVGMAMKLTRYATGRHKTISMWDSFHGASLDAISIGGEPLFRDDLGPLLPGCLHLPWPNSAESIDAVERMFAEHDDIGAVISEPMRCTTIQRPPHAYWQRVRELCDQHGALLIFDEIPVALGRTGRMFCCEHTGVVPDILVIGKGLGGGVFPLAGIIVHEDLDIVGHRALGHYTHEKSSVGCAAALATLDVIEEDQLLENADQLGNYALEQLRAIQDACDLISDVRGIGLALAVELRRNGLPATAEAEQVMYACLSRGLSFKVSAGTVLTLTPPLTITQMQLDQAIDILNQAIADIARTDLAVCI